jgi:5-methylcytosine-specific restriction endonuclease McrA
VHEWKIRTDTTYLRRRIFERDHGVCGACGLDTVAMLAQLKELRVQDWCAREQVDSKRCTRWARPYVHPFRGELARRNYPTMVERAIELGLGASEWSLERSLWQADHIVPVSEGGGECGLDNIRTLCWKCHRAETAKLAERARLRRVREQAGDLSPAVEWIMGWEDAAR